MLKKIQLIFAFALVVLASGVYAQAQASLDVIYRDFPVTAYGFEEFMACDDAGNSNSTAVRFTNDGRYTTNGNGTELKYGECPNSNGRRGYKNGPDKECDMGNWENTIKVTLGMVGPTLFYDPNCSQSDLQEDPDGQNRNFVVYRYCARPTAGNDNCSSKLSPGNKIVQWFSSTGEAREIRNTVELKWNGSYYVVEYNANTSNKWNDDGSDNGFFPLDKYDDGSNKTWGRQSLNQWCPDNGDNNSGGICPAWYSNGGPRSATAGRTTAQNRGIKHKLHNYGFSAAGSGQFKYDASQNDIFKFIGDDDMWIFIDGNLAADLGGVHLAAPANINIKEYATKTGPWSNRSGEVWADGSTHVVNFFYMDRNTDGSNFKLEMKLSGLAPPRFGAPEIKKAETVQKQDGTSETTIYVNNKIENLQNFINTNEFPIIIKKPGNPDLLAYKIEKIIDGPVNMGSEGYAYVITGQVCKSKTECGGTWILNSGDSLSFNVLQGQDIATGGFRDPNNFGLPSDNWYIKSTNGTPATQKSWAINTTNLPPIDFKPDVPDKTPVKPPFVILPGEGGGDQGDRTVPGGAGGSVGKYDGGGKFPNVTQVWDAKTGTMVSINTVPGAGVGNSGDVHGFGVVGKQIPPQRTGELILTVFPSTTNAAEYEAWSKDPQKQKLFGLPPSVENPETGAWWGLANPSKPAEHNGIQTGGYQFVKNGFPNESSTKGNIKIAPTRCTTIFDKDGEPRINCLNFSLVAKQPFQLAVTVYDQLGNFVTQYRETLSEQEFRNVVQAPNYVNYPNNFNANGASTGCKKPDYTNYGAPTTLTTNGQINVNVNIYPFSLEGRRFGNGVYIVKIDRVDLPFKDGIDPNDPTTRDPNTGNGYTCASAGGGNSTRTSPSFIRYHADQKFGWMRSTSK